METGRFGELWGDFDRFDGVSSLDRLKNNITDDSPSTIQGATSW
jgi:hypothetical protein